MPFLIQPGKVVSKEFSSKDGECVIHLTMDLNININSSADGTSVSIEGAKNKKIEEEEKVEMIVPQFTSGQKVKFGKKDD